MKVLFDTCVVLDILARGSYFKDSLISYDVALLRKMDVCLAITSTSDIAYLLHSRNVARGVDAELLLALLFEQFDVIDAIARDGIAAVKSDMSDYEDALIAQIAARNGVEVIVTRNKKDFAASPVPAMTPVEFVELYKPASVSYDELDF